jgi:hypothetical protein
VNAIRLLATVLKRVTGTAAFGAALSLMACVTPPRPPLRPLPDTAYQAAAGVAYLWPWGHAPQPAFSLPDEAFLARIDDTDVPTSNRYAAYASALLEIPAGKHVVYLLDRQQTLLCGYLGDCLWSDKPGRVLELTAEPGRVYVPYIADHCSRKLFWIADIGPYDPRAAAARNPWRPEPGKPVAGEAPAAGRCVQAASGLHEQTLPRLAPAPPEVRQPGYPADWRGAEASMTGPGIRSVAGNLQQGHP